MTRFRNSVYTYLVFGDGQSSPKADQRYETAIVYLLPAHLEQRIVELRGQLSDYADSEQQLRPHVTALFVGVRTGATISQIGDAIRIAPQVDAACSLGDVDCFEADGRVINMHLRFAPDDELRAAHQHYLRLFYRIGESSDTPLTSERYVPHISLFDRISMSAAEYEAAKSSVGTQVWSGKLRDLAFMCREVAAAGDAS